MVGHDNEDTVGALVSHDWISSKNSSGDRQRGSTNIYTYFISQTEQMYHRKCMKWREMGGSATFVQPWLLAYQFDLIHISNLREVP